MLETWESHIYSLENIAIEKLGDEQINFIFATISSEIADKIYEKWDSLICNIQTINCQDIIFHIEDATFEDANLVDFFLDLGEVEIDGSTYLFKDVWNSDNYIKIVADELRVI